jgi:hypothetical protein
LICTKRGSLQIHYRDAQSYFAILLEDIGRLHLNRSKKYLETFDGKGGDKKEIQSIDDIYKHSGEITAALTSYE